MRRLAIHKPDTRSRAYRQLWRVVDGAVADALEQHPDYLTEKGLKSARRSVVKRVTGSVIGYVEQSTQGRSGVSPAADNEKRHCCMSHLRRALSYVRRLVGFAPGQPLRGRL